MHKMVQIIYLCAKRLVSRKYRNSFNDKKINNPTKRIWIGVSPNTRINPQWATTSHHQNGYNHKDKQK